MPGSLMRPTAPMPATAEAEAAGVGLSSAQILVILRAYWKHSAIIAAALIVVGAAGIKLLPKSYVATATLKVNHAIKDPLAGENAIDQEAGAYIPTEMQLMESSEVLLPAIDKLDLTNDRTYTSGFRGNTANLRLWVKQRLIKNLDIEQGNQGSYLINVSAVDRNPVRAAQIANAVAESYVEQERRWIDQPAAERAERYAEQLAELKAKVSAAEAQVAAFRQRTGITDPGGQKNSQIEALETLQQRLDQAVIAHHEAEVHYQANLAASSATTGAQARVSELRGKLDGLRSQLAQLQTTLGPEHPKIRELKAQIASVEQNIASELQSYTRAAKADLDSAQALVGQLQQAVENQRAKALAASKLQDEGNKYVLELESAQSVYKRALDGYDQIMFAWRGHYTYVDLVSHADPPLISTKPNKKKLFAVLVAVALAAGVGIPLAYELFVNRRVRCRDDLERGFGLAVLIEMRGAVA